MEEKHSSSRQNGEQHQTWGQKIKQYQVAIGVVAIVLVAVIALIAAGYIFHWGWTGLNGGYSKITITSSIKGGTKADEQQPAKTLWDWMQLLFIPAVLAVGGFLFNITISRNEQKATEQRDKTERDIALDNQRESALQAYIDKMSELLLKENLQKSASDAEVREIARTRTLTALRGLDSNRKGALLQFLHEAGLIQVKKTVIDLSLGGDFSDPLVANLSGANLYGAELRKACLRKTNLQMADLRGADLSEANLWGADLRRANLGPLDPLSTNSPPTGLLATQLNSADLAMAYLTSANLKGAVLSGANLSGADLSFANLKDATGITNEELEKQATSLQGATMLDGKIHP